MRTLATVTSLVVLALLVAPAASPPQATRASDEAPGIPLGDSLASMEPQTVWQAFYDLTQVPRPSHHEEQATAYLAALGAELGLETTVDDVGNVIIRKPAAAGLETRHGVVLQAHMDMVPQTAPGKDFDFETDAIEAYVDGDWVIADGTTLGADDGIGVALALGVLQSDVALGPIEALFTVNEEDGMDGASGLQQGVLQGDILINLDSETEGEFTIGSAGGEYADGVASFSMVPVPADTVGYTLTVGGLQGGHSGVEIGLGRGHATKLLVRLLRDLADAHDLRLAAMAGGTAANAIPTSASAVVVVPTAQAAAFEADVRAYEATLQDELAIADPGVTVTASPAEIPGAVLDEDAQDVLIDVLYGTPQGVMRMSDAVPGLVETSTNMGILELSDGQLAITCLMRSSVDSELQDLHQMLGSVWRLAALDTTFSGLYGGWQPNPDSPILGLMTSVYEDLYGREPAVGAVHAGLEAGTIVAKHPGMDAISVGPTLEHVHSIDERLEIGSVAKLDDLLMATLQQIPVK